jgi:hypothetical protein
MPLNLFQQTRGAIVDRVVEWGEDGKERPLQEIPRGIIVHVEGEPEQEQIDALYVAFGEELNKKTGDLVKALPAKDITVHDVTVKTRKVKAAELVEVFPADTKAAKEAWKRLFRIPANVGLVSENRKAKGMKRRKITDPLGLTPTPDEGPVKDNPTGMDLPEAEA